jgi:glycosyltransferase involved in cell wall biosynthesis
VRLLHVHSGNLYGGVETVLLALERSRTLCPQMHPEFALCFEGRVAAELRQAGARVYIVGPVRARNPFQVVGARRRLVGVLRAGAFDAVICHMAWPLAVFGPVARRVRLPLIFWMHDAVTRRNWLSLWARLSFPDLVICNSRFTASTLERLFKRALAKNLYYPVPRPQQELNPADRQALRRSLKTPDEAAVIVQTSRMEPWKGHHLLLEALGQLADVPHWVCWIAGSAQRSKEFAYERILHERVIELGLAERIRFLGQRSDVARLLAAADIFCQPNTGAEPFGVALIEAMHAGLPVVTTATGGPLEILNEACSILVRPNDASSLAAQLDILLRDEALRHRLGAAGRRRAIVLCDPRTQLQRLQAIIQQAVDGGNMIPVTAP